MELERTEEFSEWLKNFRDQKAKVAVVSRLAKIAKDGHLGDGHHLTSMSAGTVSGQLWELRWFVGSAPRVYYEPISGEQIWLIYGGIKDTQDRDIKQAKAIWQSYQGG